MRFVRYHGLGNDYLVLDHGGALTAPLVRALCDRHLGLGSDGILEPLAGEPGTAAGVRIWNPDGSVAEKSGNGLRIFAHWLRDLRPGTPSSFRVWTAGGVVRCDVRGSAVAVDMGVAMLAPPRLLDGLEYHPVNVGNPHHVCLSVPEDWRRRGAVVEGSVEGRTNVQFAEVAGPHRVRAWVWERGAGETQSSGSSACAVAFVAVRAGGCKSPVTVEMPGGALVVDVFDDGGVRLEGPVERVARIEVDPDWLRHRAR